MTSDRSPSSRRSALGRTTLHRRTLVGVIASAGLAGCLGGFSEDPEPIALTGQRECDNCGMIVSDHPGPVGQIYFSDDDPEGGRPGQFCSSTCAYTYRFEQEDAGRTVEVMYLTDYSIVDQEVREEGGDVLFSSHVEADAFAAIDGLTVVAGSDVVGAMGPELIPFSDEGDVESFQETYGGEAFAATAVDRTLLEGLK